MVRSARLYGPALLPAVTAPFLTVPAGHLYVIRGVSFSNSSGSVAAGASLYLGGSTSTERIYKRTIAVNETDSTQPWLVLGPGDVLWGSRSGAPVSVYLTGYDLLV